MHRLRPDIAVAIEPGRLARWLGAAALLAVATACPVDGDDASGEDSDTSIRLVDAWCVSDGDCRGGEVCIQGLCSTETPEEPVEYGARLMPPNDASIAPTLLAPSNRSPLGADLVAEPAEMLEGTIETADGQPAPDATLLVVPDDPDQSALSRLQRPVRDGQFSLRAPADDVRLKLLVDDSRWPVLDLGDLDATELNFEIPTLDQLPAVEGQLTRQALELVDLTTEPVEGASVLARPTDGHGRSGVVHTDEDGRFRLVLPDGADEFDVHVRPGPDNPLVPRADFGAEFDAGADDISLSLGELDLDVTSLDVAIDAPAVDDTDPQWQHWRIELRRSVDVGDLVVATEPDDQGRAQFDVPPGNYDIEVTPPAGSPWSATSRQVDIVDGLSTVDVEMPTRPNIRGEITTQAGPLEATRIELYPLDDQPRPPALQTDRQGTFEGWLDPGEYRLVVRPPADLGLPKVHRHIDVDTTDSTTVDVTVPRGLVATGTVTTPDGVGVPETRVEIFGPDPDTPQRRLLADAVTGPDGTYRIVLSPQLVGH